MSRAIDKGTMLNLIIEAKRTDPETGSFAEWLAEYLVDHLPTLTQPNDFTPVQHGRWVKPVPGDGENYCSVCHADQPWFYGYGYYDSDYCPNCGACMDSKEVLKDGSTTD